MTEPLEKKIYNKAVSIIITLTLNEPFNLNRFLSSFISCNTYRPFELIVIDHTSLEPVVETIRKYSSRGFIFHLKTNDDYNYARSNNLAAKKAVYPNLLFVSSAIVYKEDVLPHFMQKIHEPAIGAIGIRLEDESEKFPGKAHPHVHHAGISLEWDQHKDSFMPFQVSHDSEPGTAVFKSGFFPAVSKAFFLCGKAGFEAVGGFCEDYYYGFEDIDFCLKLGTILNKRCYCINDLVLQHYEGATRYKMEPEEKKRRREHNDGVFKRRMGNLVKALVEREKGHTGGDQAVTVSEEVVSARGVLQGPGWTASALKVLFVLPVDVESNDGYHVRSLIRGLKPFGVESAIAIPGKNIPEKKTANSEARLLSYEEALTAGVPFSSGDGPDLIHAWTPREKVRCFVEKLRERYHCPVVVHMEDNEEYLLESSTGRKVEDLKSLTLQKLDALVPPNRYHPLRGRKYLEQAGGLTMVINTLSDFNFADRPALTILPGVDECLFFPRPLNYDLRRVMDIGDDDLVLVYTGNLHAGNREEIGELYKAIRILNERGRTTYLLRTGLNARCPAGEDPVNRPSLEKFVRHMGWVSRETVPEIMAAANIFVQPGEEGPFNDYRVPCKLPEFFALGRPVILPRANLGLKAIHSREAYVLDRADGVAIASAALEISSDGQLAERLSEGAVNFYLDQLADSRVAEKLFRFYLTVSGKKDELQAGGAVCPEESASLPVIHIVTPCLNAVETIDRTIGSIVSQSGNFKICYHIQDGGSVDGTVAALERWSERLARGKQKIYCGGVDFTWASEPDQGIYDAITRGFAARTADENDFMTWLNGDDVLMPGALAMVCRVQSGQPRIEWLGSPQYVIDDRDGEVLKRSVPTPTAVIRAGLCDGEHWYMLQQEGTFFKKRLWFKARHALDGFRLAGDWNLWRHFALHAAYYQSARPLAAFRKRRGQASIEHIQTYRAEVEQALSLQERRRTFMEFERQQNQYAWIVKEEQARKTISLEKEYASVNKLFNLFYRKSCSAEEEGKEKGKGTDLDRKNVGDRGEIKYEPLLTAAEAALKSWQWREAAELYRQLLKGDSEHNTAQCYVGLYIALRNMGRCCEAEEIIRQAPAPGLGHSARNVGKATGSDRPYLTAKEVATKLAGPAGVCIGVHTELLPTTVRGKANHGIFLHTCRLELEQNDDSEIVRFVEKISSVPSEYIFYHRYYEQLEVASPGLVPALYGLSPLGEKHFKIFMEFMENLKIRGQDKPALAGPIGAGMAAISLLNPGDELSGPNRIGPILIERFAERLQEAGFNPGLPDHPEPDVLKSRLSATNNYLEQFPCCPAHDDLFWPNMAARRKKFSKTQVIFLDWGSFKLNYVGADLYHYINQSLKNPWLVDLTDRVIRAYLAGIAGEISGLTTSNVLFTASYNAVYKNMTWYLRHGRADFATRALQNLYFLEALLANDEFVSFRELFDTVCIKSFYGARPV